MGQAATSAGSHEPEPGNVEADASQAREQMADTFLKAVWALFDSAPAHTPAHDASANVHASEAAPAHAREASDHQCGTEAAQTHAAAKAAGTSSVAAARAIPRADAFAQLLHDFVRDTHAARLIRPLRIFCSGSSSFSNRTYCEAPPLRAPSFTTITPVRLCCPCVMAYTGLCCLFGSKATTRIPGILRERAHLISFVRVIEHLYCCGLLN